MRSVASSRVAACVVAAAFASAPAVILPANAGADDGTAPVDPIAAVAEATGIDVALPTEGDTAAAADATVTTALDSAAPDAEPAGAEAATEPAAETADPALTVNAPPEAAMPDVEPVFAPPDTTTSMPDTTPDTAAGQPTPTSSPVAVQTTPTNLNVSVRIASAGDNGPVTQTNVAAVASTAATAVAPKAAATTSTAASAPSGTDTASPPRATAPASTAQDDAGTWEWQWDCVSVPAISAISQNDSSSGSAPRNWTWIWNCGDNYGQYQGATVAQYQPSNVNVSIRIASPGNDGPVNQANVAVAVSTGISMPHGASTPAVSVPPAVSLPVPVVTLPAIPGVSALPGFPAVLSPVLPSLPQPSLESGVAALVGPGAGPLLGELDELPFVAPPAPERDAVSILVGGARPVPGFRPGSSAVPQTSLVGPAAWSAGTTTAALAATEAVRPAATAPEKRAKPAPRWRTPAPTMPAPAQAPPGTSAAAAGGGGSSGGGGLPFFLAVPFVAAMLDLARRAALDRVATPSGHRSRMPENPG